MGGFSPDVRKQAKIDGTELVGPKDVEQVFDESGMLGLIKTLRKLRGLNPSYPVFPLDLKRDTTLSNVSGSDFSIDLSLMYLGKRSA